MVALVVYKVTSVNSDEANHPTVRAQLKHCLVNTSCVAFSTSPTSLSYNCNTRVLTPLTRQYKSIHTSGEHFSALDNMSISAMEN